MSGAAFEGLSPGTNEPGAYTPGNRSPGCDLGLVERLVAIYSERNPWGKKFENDIRDKFSQQIDSIDDPDEFLYRIALELANTLSSSYYLRESNHLFDPLIESLYETGRRPLTLDLTPLSIMPEDLAWGCSGAEGSPLQFDCIFGKNPSGSDAGSRSIGRLATHCAIGLSGTVDYAGPYSTFSDYTLGKHVRHLGQMASSCVFRLAGVTGISSWALGWDFSDVRVRLAVERPGGTEETWLDMKFFERGNALLIPEGNGGWKEFTIGYWDLHDEHERLFSLGGEGWKMKEVER